MIDEVDKRPSCFNRIPENSRWFRLIKDDDENLYGWLTLQNEAPAVGVHLEIFFYTPGVLKQMVADWPEVVKVAKGMGATTLYATNFEYTDARWPKFIRYFGFPHPVILAFSQQEV